MKIKIEFDGKEKVYNYTEKHKEAYLSDGVILNIKHGEKLVDRMICYDGRYHEVTPIKERKAMDKAHAEVLESECNFNNNKEGR